MNLVRNMIISAVLLALFAIAGTYFVSQTYDNTIDKINENKRLALLKAFHVLIPPSTHDNDMFTDFIEVQDEALSEKNKTTKIYRARKNNKPVAVIINSVAPDGYNGNIELLVAINYNGTLAGVRVIQHKETPGLGDAIDENRSNWILSFNNLSLTNPDNKGWAVKRDGGEFDQFTGATITPRAIVKAVYKTLHYYNIHKENLFSPLEKVIRHE